MIFLFTESSDDLLGINLNKYPISTLYPEILVGIETLSPMFVYYFILYIFRLCLNDFFNSNYIFCCRPLKYHEFREVYMYVLAYWNVVDMLFKKLKTIDVRINIAAIVMGTVSIVNLNT